jgi:hypothetical protein
MGVGGKRKRMKEGNNERNNKGMRKQERDGGSKER